MLKKCISDTIYTNQSIPKRNINGNSGFIINTIEYNGNKRKEAALIFLDVGSVFDNLQQTFLFAVLNKTNPGEELQIWVI